MERVLFAWLYGQPRGVPNSTVRSRCSR